MDALRLGSAYDLYDQKFGAVKGRELQLRCAPIVVFAHRDLRLRGFDDSGVPSDSHEANDAGVVYGGARLRATYRDFSVDAEYAISPGLDFGGDFHGTQQDFELRGTW